MSASSNDTFLGRVRRRLVTIPGLLVMTALYTAVLPLLLLAAVLMDLAKEGLRLRPTVRMICLIEGFLLIETVGITALGVVFACAPFSVPRRQLLTYRVQRLYIRAHWGWIRWVYALRFEVKGEEALAEARPWVVFVRHSSLLDVVLPGFFLGHRHDLRLRYILKRELLAEPCLDVACHFLPNYFVARGGVDTAREVEAICDLKRTLHDRDAVIIYPEGTHFSPEKRQRALERLSGEARVRAESLRHLLPCRSGGPLALLEEPTDADFLFFGHHGFEGLSNLGSLRSGDLVGRTIRIQFWREAGSTVPSGEDDRARAARSIWLSERWQRIDDWVQTFES